MNIGNILKVADAIESSELANRDIGFNMGTLRGSSENDPDLSGHACGTVACIAGTAVALFDGVRAFHCCDDPDDRATQLFDLTRVGLFSGAQRKGRALDRQKHLPGPNRHSQMH